MRTPKKYFEQIQLKCTSNNINNIILILNKGKIQLQIVKILKSTHVLYAC